MNSYFIYHSEKFQGPFTTEEIASLLRQSVITVQEYLYDLQFRCIFQIGEVDDFKNFLPLKPPTLRANDDYLIYKNNKVEGPFGREKIAEMLTGRKLLAFDYITLWGGSSWLPIKNVPVFKDYIQKAPDEKCLNFGQSGEEESRVNTIVREELMSDIQLTQGIIRKYPRTPYSSSATVIHNNKSYIGTCTTLSVSGCFIQMQTPPFQPGDEVTIIIKPDMIPIPIEVNARVMSLNDGNIKGLGVQFLTISNDVRMEVQKFVSRYINMVKKRNN